MRKVIEFLSQGDHKGPDATYYKVIFGRDRIVGGLFVEIHPGRGECRCEGIYVDPDYQNQGIGKEIMRQMFRKHPDARRWTLETPVWATRNHHFYKRMGFVHFGTCDLDLPEEF